MAHKGKTYRLHNRRDICIGLVTYQRALPLRFIWTWQFATTSSTGQFYGTLGTRIDPEGDLWSKTPLWQSTSITQNGRTFKLRLQMVGIDQPNQKLIPEWTIWTGTTLRAKWPGYQYYQEFFDRYDCGGLPSSVLYWDAGYWGGLPVNAGSQTRPLYYHEE